jgi:hypothetical protein
VNEKYKNVVENIELKENNILDRFLKLPLENLEIRIKEIEKEVNERIMIKKRIHADLEHERKRFEEKNNELNFNKFSGNFLSRRTTLESQMLNIKKAKQQEEVSCFGDLQRLRQELRFAKEELKKEKEKSKLLLE